MTPINNTPRHSFLEDDVPIGIAATDRLLYLDGKHTVDLSFAEVYGISLRKYEVVQNVRRNEEIINEF